MKSLENLSKRVYDDSVVIDIGNRKKELSFVSHLSKAIIWKYIHGREDRIEQDIEGVAKLVKIAQPTFVELKGIEFSSSSHLQE